MLFETILPTTQGIKFIRSSRSWKRGSLRWKLRKAVKAVNQALGSLNLEKHPDKTFIGRIERGFDFLGYHFRPDRLSVAAKTIENFAARALRLYEQEPGEPLDSSRLGVYVRLWVRWVGAGLAGTSVEGRRKSEALRTWVGALHEASRFGLPS